METYQAFGLAIQSELKLPCLPALGWAMPDLVIDFGPVDEKGLENPAQFGPYSQSKPEQVWLGIPGIARFLITGGDRIRIDPEPAADAHALGLFVLGSCMGAILHQRGSLVLHGSALRFGDGCVIFAGDSGAGKSTTAAGLYLRGHEILADDQSVIDGEGRVQAGIPQIKLWADAARKLGVDTGELTRIRPGADKYAYPTMRGFCDKPLPLSELYVLRIHDRKEILFETVRGAEKMGLLNKHTYRFEYVQGLGLQARQLMQCSRLANRIGVTVITRPASGSTLDEWLECLEAHRLPLLAAR